MFIKKSLLVLLCGSLLMGAMPAKAWFTIQDLFSAISSAEKSVNSYMTEIPFWKKALAVIAACWVASKLYRRFSNNIYSAKDLYKLKDMKKDTVFIVKNRIYVYGAYLVVEAGKQTVVSNTYNQFSGGKVCFGRNSRNECEVNFDRDGNIGDITPLYGVPQLAELARGFNALPNAAPFVGRQSNSHVRIEEVN